MNLREMVEKFKERIENDPRYAQTRELIERLNEKSKDNAEEQ